MSYVARVISKSYKPLQYR